MITADASADCSRPDFEAVNILDFERRVKDYAHPANNGKVSISQLKRAFEDTRTFRALGKPHSLTHKLLKSPFFVDFTLSHNVKDKTYAIQMHERYLSTVISETDQRYSEKEKERRKKTKSFSFTPAGLPPKPEKKR